VLLFVMFVVWDIVRLIIFVDFGIFFSFLVVIPGLLLVLC
jgi:hypothetical protein